MIIFVEENKSSDSLSYFFNHAPFTSSVVDKFRSQLPTVNFTDQDPHPYRTTDVILFTISSLRLYMGHRRTKYSEVVARITLFQKINAWRSFEMSRNTDLSARCHVPELVNQQCRFVTQFVKQAVT